MTASGLKNRGYFKPTKKYLKLLKQLKRANNITLEDLERVFNV